LEEITLLERRLQQQQQKNSKQSLVQFLDKGT